MAYKKERMEKIVERELSSIIFSEIKDERIKFVTITNVDMTSDLSVATVFYTVLGTEDQNNASIDALLDASGFIRSMLAKRLEVKKVPELRFRYDESFEKGNKIEEILRNLK